jgi:two-component system CheB/CheR fusion protein
LAAEQPADPAAFAGSAIRSFVSVPLLRDGRFRTCLFASFRDPHRWDAEEVALIESVAARLWDALERTRAEAPYANSTHRSSRKSQRATIFWRASPVAWNCCNRG